MNARLAGLALALGVVLLRGGSLDAAEPGAGGSAARPEIEELLKQGFALIEADNPTGAVEVFRQVIAIDHGNRSAKYGISSAYIKMERYRESIALLETLMTQYPADFVLKNNVGWLYATAEDARFRDARKAVRYAQEALLLQPADYHVWSTLAEAHYRDGAYDKALRAARVAVDLAQQQLRENPGALMTYVDQMKKCAEAVQAFALME